MKKVIHGFPYLFSSFYWKRSYKRIISVFFASFGVAWTFIEAANHFGMEIVAPATTPLTFSFLLIVALLISLIINFPILVHSLVISDTDVKLELTVGNYLKMKGDKVIATNSTFDTTHNKNFISPKSVQGQFFKRFYDNISHLDNDLASSLESEEPAEVLDRRESKTNRYNIGTVAKLNHNEPKPFWDFWSEKTEFRSYWVAMADVNKHGKPNSNFENLQTSLVELWHFISTRGHLENLVIPILGSGRTGIIESRERILQEIVFSFVVFASEKKITEKLSIVIHPNDLLKHDINFYELCDFITFNCKYKSSKNFGNSKEI